jgi:hypothetical protein
MTHYLCTINQVKVMSYESKSSEFGRTEADVRAVLGGMYIGQ